MDSPTIRDTNALRDLPSQNSKTNVPLPMLDMDVDHLFLDSLLDQDDIWLQVAAGETDWTSGIHLDDTGIVTPLSVLPENVSDPVPDQLVNDGLDLFGDFDWLSLTFDPTTTTVSPIFSPKSQPTRASTLSAPSQPCSSTSRATHCLQAQALDAEKTMVGASPWMVDQASGDLKSFKRNAVWDRVPGMPDLPNHLAEVASVPAAGASPTSALPQRNPEWMDPSSPLEEDEAWDPKQPPVSFPYQAAHAPKAWGSTIYNGQLLFSYTPKGQWLLDRCFNAMQLREYAMGCPPSTIFWLQQAPTGSVHRLDPEDRLCRWANCPMPNRRIASGWLRIAFDECPGSTSDGTKDPYKVAGSLHLWCFEQVFDPLEFHMSGRLRPERRKFPHEERSTVTLEKLTDAGIIREAYLPWMAAKTQEWRVRGPLRKPRPHHETLSYALNKYHLDNQTAARQRARLRRNAHRSEAERRTIDVHVGDLGLYAKACRKASHRKKRNRLGGRNRVEATRGHLIPAASRGPAVTTQARGAADLGGLPMLNPLLGQWHHPVGRQLRHDTPHGGNPSSESQALLPPHPPMRTPPNGLPRDDVDISDVLDTALLVLQDPIDGQTGAGAAAATAGRSGSEEEEHLFDSWLLANGSAAQEWGSEFDTTGLWDFAGQGLGDVSGVVEFGEDDSIDHLLL